MKILYDSSETAGEKKLQFYFLIIGQKFTRCVTFWEFWKTFIPGDTVKACRKRKSRQYLDQETMWKFLWEEKFYFVSFGQKKNKAHEACIQWKHNVNNRTDSSECKHVVACAIEKIISCNIHRQNGAPQHRYMLGEVAVTGFVLLLCRSIVLFDVTHFCLKKKPNNPHLNKPVPVHFL